MALKFTNNASAQLAASISASSVSLTVTTGQGALFPSLGTGDYFYATLVDSSNNLEIVKITARVSDTLTAVRAQEGTSARAYAAADKLELRVTAAALTNFVTQDRANTFTDTNTFNGATTLAGTNTLSGNTTFSGTNSFTGANTFGNMPTFSAGLLPPSSGGTGVNNNASSTFAISGPYATTITISGITTITLPTTGTVSTLAGTETFTNKTLTNPTVTNYVETVQSLGTVGATSTLSLTTGTILTASLTGGTPCTFTMPTVTTAGKSFILILTQASVNMTTATFTGVKWTYGTPPVVSATASAVDIFSFVSNGTSWYGTYAQAMA